MEIFTKSPEGTPLKDSMFSDRESLSNASNLSSVASSYKYPSSGGLFSSDYRPFSLEDVQQKHKAMLTDRDYGCNEKRNESQGTYIRTYVHVRTCVMYVRTYQCQPIQHADTAYTKCC